MLYDVVPGTPSVVHHVLGMLVDADAPSELAGQTNGDRMAALDAESPDRDGWPCFGMAGDGVQVKSVPVIWAPGQGVVELPGESGVPLMPNDRVVFQVHYNLADNPGALTDTSQVRLRLAPKVKNVGVFVLDDPLLDTLRDDEPHALAPGRASVKYAWTRPLSDYFEDLPNVELYGLMPHMHQRVLCAAHPRHAELASRGHVRLRHLLGYRARASRLGHSQRDVPGDDVFRRACGAGRVLANFKRI